MSYPKAPDRKIQKLTNLLVRYAESKDIVFSFSGEEIFAVEAFSHFGGLALFMLEAKEQYEKVYNKLYSIEELLEVYDKNMFKSSKAKALTEEQKLKDKEYLDKQPKKNLFPIELVEQEDKTYFGFIVRVSPDNLNIDFSNLAHFTLHAVEEYIKKYNLENNNESKLIPLDELYDKMVKKINNKEVMILSADTAASLYAHIDNKTPNKSIETV